MRRNLRKKGDEKELLKKERKRKTVGKNINPNFMSRRKKLAFIALVLFLMNVSFLTYYKMLHFKSIYEIVENRYLCIFEFFSSVTMMFLATRIILLIKLEKKTKVILLLLNLVYLLLVLFIDRSSKELGYGYGMYTAISYGATIVSMNIFLSTTVFVVRFLERRNLSFRPIYFATFVITGLLFLYFGYEYVRRKKYFDQGLFGDHYDRSSSYCNQYNDVMIFSKYKPKNIVHMMILTYWCRKDPVFTSVESIEHSETDSVIEIDKSIVSKDEECSISLFPNLDHITFEEYMERTSVHTHLQKHLLKKVVNKKIGKERRFVYDSKLYETSLVTCGNHRNIVVSPKRRIKRKIQDVDSETHPNVILIWLDCVTRKNFEIDFPKTISAIGKILLVNEDIEFYQFYNHRVIGWNTLPQYRVMMTGYLSKNGNASHPLWVEGKENGYVTVTSSDQCNEQCTRYNRLPSRFDYTHHEPFCSPEYTNPSTHFSPTIGPSSAARKCLFQKEAPEYVFDYMKKLERIYPEKSKLMFGMLGDAHEGTGESVHYLDLPLSEYLIFLKESGALEKSVVWLFGDHGNHASIVNRMMGERALGKNPALYLLAPKKYMDVGNRREMVQTNKFRMVTAYDLHKTWSSMVGGKAVMNEYGFDILSEEVPRERNCKDANIGDANCVFLVCKIDENEYKTFLPDGRYTV